MDLSGPSRHIDSRGSKTNRSLSFALAWAVRCNCIMRLGSRGSNCRGFCFSHAPTLTIGSLAGLLVGCLGGQFAQHWSGS